MNLTEYHNIIQSKKKPRKQIEGLHQRTLGTMLNGVLKPRLNPNLVFWTYSAAGEYKNIKTAVLQKTKGLNRGDPDYRFHLIEDNTLVLIVIETKSSKGKLTTEQQNFFEKHKNLKNVRCYKSKSIEESIEILKRERILLFSGALEFFGAVADDN